MLLTDRVAVVQLQDMLTGNGPVACGCPKLRYRRLIFDAVLCTYGHLRDDVRAQLPLERGRVLSDEPRTRP